MTLVIGSGGGGGGGKGGGGGGHTPHEAKDNLDSKQFAKVLDCIGEGELQGLVDGAKSIFLNNTPLQAADGSYNFKDVSWEARTGTSSQTVIPITENTFLLIIILDVVPIKLSHIIAFNKELNFGFL